MVQGGLTMVLIMGKYCQIEIGAATIVGRAEPVKRLQGGCEVAFGLRQSATNTSGETQRALGQA